METPRLPTIIAHVDNRCAPSPPSLPLSLNAYTQAGFDKLVPEGRHTPWKYLPCPGARLSVAFGTPVSPGGGARCARHDDARTGRYASRSRKSSSMSWGRLDDRCWGPTHWPGAWGYNRHYHRHCRRGHEWTSS
ncbi:hypothetical protein EDB89DRAFT_1979218 [Lactarius sanguifluus]|nr:hypothetical protein EDB89DRAFT_1979218 [Lactarius sanguifluus]